MSVRFAGLALVILSAAGLSQPAPASAQTHDHTAAVPAEAADTQGATVDHSAHTKQAPSPVSADTPITDEERAAAFPDVEGHGVHDNTINYYVLFDQLEWQGTGGGGLNWDNKGWVGRDKDRLWFRSEFERDNGRVDAAEAHLLYGRAVARWWELVAGIRQDFRPGSSQTWAAVGVQGLAPYWFEVEATAYVGESGRTAVRLETEYELLLTNRLVLQPLVEVNLYGKADPERGIGAGLSTTDIGLRVRYEFRREIAPYVGVTWNRKYGGTADFAAAGGGQPGSARLVLGARVWF